MINAEEVDKTWTERGEMNKDNRGLDIPEILKEMTRMLYLEADSPAIQNKWKLVGLTLHLYYNYISVTSVTKFYII